MNSSPNRERSWLVAALVLAHLCLVLRHFPPSLALHGEVPMRGDTSRYFATAYGASRADGLLGYEPDFMAGYPVGLWNSMGKKGFELPVKALPGLPVTLVFYGTLVAVAALAPLVLWLGMRRFVGGRPAREVLLLVAVAYWHLSTQTSYFWHNGNVFFPAMACLVPVSAGLLDDILQARRPLLRGVLLGVLSAVMFYCHTVILVAALLPWLWLPFARRTALRASAPRRGLLAWGAVAAVLCIGWLLPLLRTAGDCVPQPHAWLQSSWKHLVMDFFSDRSYRHRFDRTSLLQLALVGGIAGAFLSRRSQPLFPVLAAGGLACLGIAYGASYLGPLAAIQPYRFTIPAEILFLAPLACGIALAYERLRLATTADRHFILIILFMVFPSFSGYALDLVHEAPVSGIPQVYRRVLEALRSSPSAGRVLCDDMNLADLIPYGAGRPVLGGLSAQAFTSHRLAGFDNDGLLFGRRAVDWEASALREACTRYAAAEAVFVHPAWVRYATGHAELFEPVVTIGGYHVYRIVGADPSWLLEGQAEIVPLPGRIEVHGITSSPLTLKFHHAGWLEATEGVVLTPAPTTGDEDPFIRAEVPRGVESFTIRRKAAWPWRDRL
jgi:hypothetical protein